MLDRKTQLRRQISIVLSTTDWQALRLEAARQRVPMTELCRRWLRPELERLRRDPIAACADDPRRSYAARPERRCGF